MEVRDVVEPKEIGYGRLPRGGEACRDLDAWRDLRLPARPGDGCGPTRLRWFGACSSLPDLKPWPGPPPDGQVLGRPQR